ncbi:MAG: hypothetical protein JXA11_15740 [Phycisphaerae bacterium]|nr:hypothetical protein [Phycisphaerae bacterium]
MSGWKRKMVREKLKTGAGSTRRMSRDHLDVLQNIEFALNSARREQFDVDVDDHACHAAIEAALTNTEPPYEAAAVVGQYLSDIRDIRLEIPEDIWKEGLRVVARSIRNHSQRRPGEVSYLDFAGDFLP